MYPEWMLADILAAWLRILSPSVWDMEWLSRWFVDRHAEKEESTRFLKIVESLDRALQDRFTERMFFFLAWASQSQVVSGQLLFHILTLAKGRATPSFTLLLIQLHKSGVVHGQWEGHNLSHLYRETLRSCVSPLPMTAAASLVKTSPRRSRA